MCILKFLLIFKFENLTSLAVSIKIGDEQFIERIFRDLKYIRHFFFYFNNFKVEISKLAVGSKQANRFALSVANQKVANFEHLHEAIEFIKTFAVW